MYKSIPILLAVLFFSSCSDKQTNKKHLFYLHGRIVEVQGINAVHEQFGKYLYQDIIDSLSNTGAIVHHEVRTERTDFYDFSQHISEQIDNLINNGIAAEDIFVLGASKGAVLAMNISNMNPHPINYILLGANNRFLEEENDWKLNGNILGIYEQSDSLAGRDYSYWIQQSTKANRFKQVQIHTGLGHGFLYRPLPEWLDLVKASVAE